MSSGTIQREPPSASAGAPAPSAPVSSSTAFSSSCVRVDADFDSSAMASALSRSLFLGPADDCSSPSSPSSLALVARERASQRAVSVSARPLSVSDSNEMVALARAERHVLLDRRSSARATDSNCSSTRRPLENPFTTDSAECKCRPVAKAIASAHLQRTAHVHDALSVAVAPAKHAAAASSDDCSTRSRPSASLSGDQHVVAAAASSGSTALDRRSLDSAHAHSKIESTLSPSPKHTTLRDPGTQEGFAEAEVAAPKRATANPPGSSFYTLCFAPSTDFEDALADADADELEASGARLDCTPTALPILALQQSTYDTLNCLEPAHSSTPSGHHQELQLHANLSDRVMPQSGSGVAPPESISHQPQLRPQVVPLAGIMSASVIGVGNEGLSSLSTCGRAPCRPGAGAARLRSCGLHRLAASEMATREAAQAAVSARILALLRPTPHYRSRTKPALPPASALSISPSPAASQLVVSTPNGANVDTDASRTVAHNNSLRLPAGGAPAAGPTLEAKVDCSEQHGCHLVLLCPQTQQVVLRESLRSIRFWGIGGPHDR